VVILLETMPAFASKESHVQEISGVLVIDRRFDCT
jgi:hypothetical protein